MRKAVEFGHWCQRHLRTHLIGHLQQARLGIALAVALVRAPGVRATESSPPPVQSFIDVAVDPFDYLLDRPLDEQNRPRPARSANPVEAQPLPPQFLR